MLRSATGDNRKNLARLGLVSFLGLVLMMTWRPDPALAQFGPSRKAKQDDRLNQNVGDVADIIRGSDLPVEGVGLVLFLPGTGNTPPPSIDRKMLLDRMRKANVPNPDKLIASRSTAIVLVKAKIPVGVTSLDPLDADIQMMGADSQNSLEGGWLIETELSRVLVTGSMPHEGKKVAVAGGPILIDAEQPQKGRIPGGVRSRVEFPLRLSLKKNYRNARMARLVEGVIGRRFFQHEGTETESLATAKTTQILELRIPRRYRNNQIRYGQVIRELPLEYGGTLMYERMENWGSDLLNPSTAAHAALRLESLGRIAAPVLRKAMESSHPQVQFFSAEALAYLDDPESAAVLAETAKNYPEFRTHALAALAALNHRSGSLRLFDLMNEAEPELRYGAFAALRIQDPGSPWLRKVSLLSPRRTDPAESSMSSTQKSGPEPFELYIIPSTGPPLVHATTFGRREVVIFGGDQRVRTPVVLGDGGSILVNASQDDRKLQITRLVATGAGTQKTQRTVPNTAGAMVVGLAQVGAGYHDVVKILESANSHHNLEGDFLTDARPRVGDAYRYALNGRDITQPTGSELKIDSKVRQTGGWMSWPKVDWGLPEPWWNPFAKKGKSKAKSSDSP